MHLPWPTILASGSPRRKELLGELIPDFQIKVTDVEEGLLPGEGLEDATQRLALKKARALGPAYASSLIISADTLVGIETGTTLKILEKPKDADHAFEMLSSLAGRTHSVVTGVALRIKGREVVFAERTAVTFRALDPEEIRDYVATGDSLDKAGGYGIQGGASGFVEKIEGSLHNVVGLPTERLSIEIDRLMGLMGQTE